MVVSPKEHIEITLQQKLLAKDHGGQIPLGASNNGPFGISSFFPGRAEVVGYEH